MLLHLGNRVVIFYPRIIKFRKNIRRHMVHDIGKFGGDHIVINKIIVELVLINLRQASQNVTIILE